MYNLKRLYYTAKINSVSCILQIIFSVKFAVSQGGNAMELQRMNENLMNKNCPLAIDVCQSVCMVKNAKTGCYTCSPYCGTGSGANMMSPNIQGGMLGNFNPSYLTEYSGCNPPCRNTYNTLGTLICSCPDPKTTISTGHLQEHLQRQGEIIRTPSTTPGTSRPTLVPTSVYKVSFKVAAVTSTKSPPKLTVTTKGIFTSSTRTPTANLHPQTGIGQTSRKINQINQDVLSTTSKAKNVPISSTESDVQFERYQSGSSSGETPENKTNIIIIFVLSTLLFVSITICIVFLVAWKRTARELHRNRNELYFVNKAIRQDSCSSRTAILPEPVYAHIGPTPEVPPRVSPLTSCSSSTPSEQFLLRTVSLSSETPLKETVGESVDKHDYLQLI